MRWKRPRAQLVMCSGHHKLISPHTSMVSSGASKGTLLLLLKCLPFLLPFTFSWSIMSSLVKILAVSTYRNRHKRIRDERNFYLCTLMHRHRRTYTMWKSSIIAYCRDTGLRMNLSMVIVRSKILYVSKDQTVLKGRKKSA